MTLAKGQVICRVHPLAGAYASMHARTHARTQRDRETERDRDRQRDTDTHANTLTRTHAQEHGAHTFSSEITALRQSEAQLVSPAATSTTKTCVYVCLSMRACARACACACQCTHTHTHTHTHRRGAGVDRQTDPAIRIRPMKMRAGEPLPKMRDTGGRGNRRRTLNIIVASGS